LSVKSILSHQTVEMRVWGYSQMYMLHKCPHASTRELFHCVTMSCVLYMLYIVSPVRCRNTEEGPQLTLRHICFWKGRQAEGNTLLYLESRLVRKGKRLRVVCVCLCVHLWRYPKAEDRWTESLFSHLSDPSVTKLPWKKQYLYSTRTHTHSCCFFGFWLPECASSSSNHSGKLDI